MILFYQYRLYGDAFLQGYFLIMAIYGWYYWKKRSTQHQKPVSVLKWHHYIIVVFASAALSLLAGYLLKNYTNSDVPYIDGFCTAVSLVAQFLMSRKILQNWLLWILVDACYVPLYIHKELMLTAVLYTLFLGIAAMGYLDWKKSWKETR